jgi:hypothetical protein
MTIGNMTIGRVGTTHPLHQPITKSAFLLLLHLSAATIEINRSSFKQKRGDP